MCSYRIFNLIARENPMQSVQNFDKIKQQLTPKMQIIMKYLKCDMNDKSRLQFFYHHQVDPL